MKTRKIFALLTALALLLCSTAAFAEAETTAAPVKTGVYSIINKTGETVTEVKITDNVTGAVNVFPTKEDDVLENGNVVVFFFDIPEAEDGNHRLTLSYKTESGREETFGTLSIETVTINLLAADAMTGATPISFSMEKAEQNGIYTLYNLTGEPVTFLSLKDNEDGAEVDFAFENGFEPGENYIVEFPVPAGRENVVLTLTFVTKSGKTGAFSTLHIEEAPISLLDIDTLTGATPISFSAPN